MARKKRTTKKKTSSVRKKVGRPRSAARVNSAAKKKRTTKRTAKRSTARTAKTRTSKTRTSTRRSAGTSELSALHQQLMAGIAKLEDRRGELVAELAEIDRQIAEFRPSGAGRSAGAATVAPRRGPGRPRKSESAAPSRGPGRGPGRRGGRAKGAGGKNLVESLREVLTGAEMRVADLVDAVQRAGYKTNSPNFRTIVNQALIKHTDVFARVGRGVYTAK
ncbi:MAG: hypothetical protein AB8G96_04575 [Phycisphaerales bacterium]